MALSMAGRVMTQATRRSMATAAETNVLKFRESETAHAGPAKDLWKKVSLFVALPMLGLVTVKTMQAPHPHQDEFHAYSWLRLRKKMFPWGDGNHSLFHNPEFNALPTGFEVEAKKHH